MRSMEMERRMPYAVFAPHFPWGKGRCRLVTDEVGCEVILLDARRAGGVLQMPGNGYISEAS